METEVLSRLDKIETALSHGDRPLCFTEAATYLNCSHSYLYKLTHKRLVPFFKPLGKKLFFKRADLEKLLYSNPVKTHAEIEQAAVNHVALRRVSGVRS
jgi:excisionase family DNA binding protein